MTDISRCFLRIHTGAILIGDVIQSNQCLVLAQFKGVRSQIGLLEMMY